MAAERGYIDEVIMPSDTRRRVARALAMLRAKRPSGPGASTTTSRFEAARSLGASVVQAADRGAMAEGLARQSLTLDVQIVLALHVQEPLRIDPEILSEAQSNAHGNALTPTADFVDEGFAGDRTAFASA